MRLRDKLRVGYRQAPIHVRALFWISAGYGVVLVVETLELLGVL